MVGLIYRAHPPFAQQADDAVFAIYQVADLHHTVAGSKFFVGSYQETGAT